MHLFFQIQNLQLLIFRTMNYALNDVLSSFIISLNPIQNGGWGGGAGRQKVSSISFSLVTSANVGISPKNILTFIFNPFATLV